MPAGFFFSSYTVAPLTVLFGFRAGVVGRCPASCELILDQREPCSRMRGNGKSTNRCCQLFKFLLGLAVEVLAIKSSL